MKRFLLSLLLVILLAGCNESGHGVIDGMILYSHGVVEYEVDQSECLANCPDQDRLMYRVVVGDSVFALYSDYEREPGEIVLVEYGVKWTNQIPGYEDMLEVLLIRIVE